MAKKRSVKQKAGDGRLANSEISSQLESLPGWRGKNRRKEIQRTYSWPGFRASLAFVAFVGELAEAAAHHPDIDVRYDKVTLTLSTHSAGGLTTKDFELAHSIDQ